MFMIFSIKIIFNGQTIETETFLKFCANTHSKDTWNLLLLYDHKSYKTNSIRKEDGNSEEIHISRSCSHNSI